MEFSEIFRNFGSLFETFKYFSILLILGVTAVMIPVNMLWKKIMTKDSLERLRKTVSGLSVYAISAIAVSIFTLFTHTKITFTYVSSATISLGICAQFLWFCIKIIRDYGFSKFIKWLSEKVAWKKALKLFGEKYNIDTKITDIIATEIENNYLDKINADAVTAFEEYGSEMVKTMYEKLKGFVKDEDLSDVALGLFGMLKESWVPQIKDNK